MRTRHAKVQRTDPCPTHKLKMSQLSLSRGHKGHSLYSLLDSEFELKKYIAYLVPYLYSELLAHVQCTNSSQRVEPMQGTQGT